MTDKKPTMKITANSLDHLGLVAGIFDKFGILEVIDGAIPKKAIIGFPILGRESSPRLVSSIMNLPAIEGKFGGGCELLKEIEGTTILRSILIRIPLGSNASGFQ